MQIVGVPAKEIDAMLEGGVGPSLEPDQDCPDCGGKFIRWGSYISRSALLRRYFSPHPSARSAARIASASSSRVRARRRLSLSSQGW